MADDFIIQARIVVDESGAVTGVTGVDQAMGRLGGRTSTVNSGISRLMGTFAALGGAFAVKRLAGGVIGLNSEVENAEGSLATLLSALGGVSVGDALPIAREQVRLLSADAAKGVGGLDDYKNAFTRLLGPALAAGASLDRIRNLTKLGITAGFALGGTAGAKNLPLDITQALTQGAGEISTKQLNIALGAIGLTTTEFNKLNKAARLEKLEEALGGFAEGAELMGQSWEAQSETLADAVKRLARTASKPLFDRWSDQLRTTNQWLERNEETLGGIAEKVGGALVRAYDQLITKATTYAAIVAGIAVSQQLPGQGGTGGGFKAPDFSGGVGQGLFGKAKGRGAGGKFTAATAGIFGTGGLPAMASSFLSVAGPMALVTGLAVSVTGAMGEWPELWTLLVGLGSALTTSFGMLAVSFGSLTENGSALNLVGGALILVFTGLGFVLNIVVRGVALVVEGIGFFVIALGTLAKTAFATIGMMTGALLGDPAMVQRARGDFAKWRAEGAAGLGESQKRMRKILGLSGDLATDLKADDPGNLDPAKLTTGKNVTNIGKVEMRIQTEVNNDPARVMVALNEGLGQLRRFSRQAQRAPLPTG